MRRWNGWGDESIRLALPKRAHAFLINALGRARRLPEAGLEQVTAAVPSSRLPDHPLLAKDPEQRVRHARGQSFPDWLALRSGEISSLPDAVAYPEDRDQVRALLSLAEGMGAAVIPYGGGTSVLGHINPEEDQRPVLTVDMGRMNRLLDLDEKSLIATFGAGTAGPEVESQLRAQGFTLGHFPQSFEYSTLGGWVATRSSGQQSLYYGRIERLFAGATLETPRGTLQIPAFPASAAGPDLREMVLGSEGRLGILTEVKVRIRPLPARESFHVLFFTDWLGAMDSVRSAVQGGTGLSMIRLSAPLETRSFLALSRNGLAVKLMEAFLSLRGAKKEKCMLVFGVTARSRQHYRHCLSNARRAFRTGKGGLMGRSLGRKWVQSRFRSPYLRNSLWELGYGVDTLETAALWEGVDDLVGSVENALASSLESDRERVLVLSHLSHLYPQGSSIYVTYLFRVADSYADTLERWKRLKRTASEMIVNKGATISHHHGVGKDHRPYLIHEKGELGMEAIRALCERFDPNGIMNPGKLLP